MKEEHTLLLRTESPLRVLAAAAQEEVLDHLSVRTYAKGHVLYLTGATADTLWLLLDGWIRLYRVTSDGAEKVLGYRTGGSLVGEDALLATSHGHSAQVQEDATCAVLSHAAATHLLEQHPSLMSEVLRLLSRDVGHLREDLVDLSIADTRRRLVCTLLTLAERHGRVDDNNECHLQVPITQQELALILGAARGTVYRLLGTLAGVRIDNTAVTISNWDEFKALHE